MYILLGILLIILGVLALRDVIAVKAPALASRIAPLAHYSEVLGFIGLVTGFFWMFEAVYLLVYIFRDPLLMIAVWLFAPLMICMGLLLGLDLLHEMLGEKSSAFILKAMQWRETLRPNKDQLGMFSIGAGILIMFV